MALCAGMPMVLALVLPGAWWLATAWPLLTLLSFQCCLINHNHQHLPMARHRATNRLIDLWLGWCCGLSGRSVRSMHNHNHHRLHGGTGDPLAAERVAHLRGWRRLLAYAFSILPHYRRVRRTNLHPHDHDRWSRMLVVGGLTGLLLWSPLAALWGWVLPWIGAQWLLITVNHLQHPDVSATAEWHHSHSVTGGILNWVTFNAGLHAAHHYAPRAHWSALPAIHRDLAPRLAPHTLHPSLGSAIRYCVRSNASSIPGSQWRTDDLSRERQRPHVDILPTVRQLALEHHPGRSRRRPPRREHQTNAVDQRHHTHLEQGPGDARNRTRMRVR
jgi:beta-carotene hydroxylase